MSREDANEEWAEDQAENWEHLVEHGMAPYLRFPGDEGDWPTTR